MAPAQIGRLPWSLELDESSGGDLGGYARYFTFIVALTVVLTLSSQSLPDPPDFFRILTNHPCHLPSLLPSLLPPFLPSPFKLILPKPCNAFPNLSNPLKAF